MGAGWIVLIVFGSLLLLFLLLLLSHVRLRVALNENRSFFRIRWLFLRRSMKIEDASRLLEWGQVEEDEETQEPKDVSETKEKQSVSLSRQIARITRLFGRIFDRLPGVLTLRARRVVVTVSSDDAAKTALLYGAVSAGLAALTELIDRSVARVKTGRRDLMDVRADFIGGKTRADVDLTLSARVFGMLRLLFLLLTYRASQKRAKRKKKKKAPELLPEKTAHSNE